VKSWRLFPRATGFGLTLAVLAVSLCAARCVVPAVSVPCHGESGDEGLCAAFGSQNWVVSPDLTLAILALLLILALAFSFAPRFSLGFSRDFLPLFAETSSPPRRLCRISGVSPRAPPRRR
jgi:hypothetical protein